MRKAMQTIIFGEYLLDNLQECLDIVKKAGFKAIESGPMILGWHSIEELKQNLDKREISLIAIHCSTQSIMDLDKLKLICNDLLKLGCKNIICSGILGNVSSKKDYELTGNIIAERTKNLEEIGIRLNYHHHDWELTKSFGNQLGIQVLMDKTDSNTGFVIDTYWSRAAEIQLKWLWDKYGTRCKMIHLKDGFPLEHRFTALGKGIARVAEVFSFFSDKSLDYIIWEQDFAEDQTIEDSIFISATWLRKRGL